MGIIAFIILGLLAGIIAKALLPGSDPGGLIITAIIGIVGALLGGFLAAALFDAHPLDEFFDISTWITAIVGSIILLAIYRAVMNRGGPAPAHLGRRPDPACRRGGVHDVIRASRPVGVCARDRAFGASRSGG